MRLVPDAIDKCLLLAEFDSGELRYFVGTYNLKSLSFSSFEPDLFDSLRLISLSIFQILAQENFRSESKNRLQAWILRFLSNKT
ncbi:hypothetical protein BpHYR1_052165 [Brachionus plicatilis]|uniref:Uncharacterized protein n=1 Tax=Brachionus plicatilis TaxID=10195 RepID=A0A3M7R5F7_BRAPC|nr:hypothetical protein BpHYR1_052165 [Brachionus plicatilis]